MFGSPFYFLYIRVPNKAIPISCLHSAGAHFGEHLFIAIDKMDIFSELLKNIVATLVSTVTIVVMFFRFMNRERLQHAKQIADVIEKTAKHVFNTSTLEHRVQNLEKQEKEQAESIKEQFSLVHSRLDQIYSIIAGLHK